jgi:hypothetical protein
LIGIARLPNSGHRDIFVVGDKVRAIKTPPKVITPEDSHCNIWQNIRKPSIFNEA